MYFSTLARRSTRVCASVVHVRGVSGGARASLYGQTTDYFKHVEAQLCVLVQIETREALADLENIAAVPGIDGIFIGPADLAASFGHLGNTAHPEVQDAVDDAFRRLKAAGKPSGYLTTNEAETARRVAQGIDFVALDTDAAMIVRAATGLLQRMRPA